MTYALNRGQRNCGITLGDAEQAYLVRTTGRDAYKRAMERSHEGVHTGTSASPANRPSPR